MVCWRQWGAAGLLVALGCTSGDPARTEDQPSVVESHDDFDPPPTSAFPECTPSLSASIYERRIAPLMEDDNPSSCNECHLAGVDLSIYVQEDPCDTMACMDENGLVDFETPRDSLVLQWILRAQPQGLITQDTIAQEYLGVLQWIEFMSSCGAAVCEPSQNPCGKPPDEFDCEIEYPDANDFEDPGGCSDRTIEALFYDRIYRWRGRCYPCHFESWKPLVEDDPSPPRWIAAGDCNVGSVHTLRNVESAGYMNIHEPLASWLLLKPLDEKIGGLEHGGAQKIHTKGEKAYADFTHFLERYGACMRGE